MDLTNLYSSGHRVPLLSPDGYVRLPLASLDALSFVHLFSQRDDDFLLELRELTVPALVAGFTEWQSQSEPTISLGWGWFIPNDSPRLLLAPDPVRSNLMLTDVRGYDLGTAQTASLVSLWLDNLDWQETVETALQKLPPVNFVS